ncbi:MAG: hypothetical protein ABMA13_19880 [Chthoniobacteraceae bacterium]
MSDVATTPVSSAWKRTADTLAPARDEPLANALYTEAETFEISGDPGLWGRLHGKVEHRLTKEPIAWTPTTLQRRMIEYYRHCQGLDIPCRMIALKIRRGGGSTGAGGLLYIHAHNFRTRAGVIGTDYEVSANLMAMVKHYDRHDTFPGWHRASKVIDDLVQWPNGSTCQRYTAENPEASRSAGLQAYHASEVARWQDSAVISAKDTLRSIRGSVPRHGFTLGIEESTANGSTGAFADTWTRARWPASATWWHQFEHDSPQTVMEFGDELQFVRIFAAWFEDDECRMEIDGVKAMRIRDTLDRTERDLIDRYEQDGPRGRRLGGECDATTEEQLAWRRSVIATEFEGDAEAFDQENPSSPGVAFASTGRHTFSREGVRVMRDLAPPAVEYGILHEQADGAVVFQRTEPQDAWLELYQEPREGYRYNVGVDTMTGKEQVKNSGASDFNAAVVLRSPFIDDEGRKQPPFQCAGLRAQNDDDPDVLTRHVWMLARFYGNCMVAPEVNSSGAAFLVLAKAMGMTLYRRQEFDKVTQEWTDHSGWKTDGKTRPQLIATLKAAIRANAEGAKSGDLGNGILSPSRVLQDECAKMARQPDGVDRAPHDDHVIALGIALVTMAGATYFVGKRRRRKGPPDRGPNAWRRHA